MILLVWGVRYAVQDMVNVLKNRLAQKDAAIDVLRINYEQQLRKLQDELSKTREEADKRAAAAASGPTRAQLAALQKELKAKDELLVQLR